MTFDQKVEIVRNSLKQFDTTIFIPDINERQCYSLVYFTLLKYYDLFMLIIPDTGVYKKTNDGVNFYPKYTFSKIDYDSKLKDVNYKLENIVKDIKCYKSDSIREKLVHDYIISHTKYEHTQNKRNILDPLYIGKGVCVGISIFFKALLEKCDIECNCIAGFLTRKSFENGKPGHVWNSVKIDGKWFLVDITLDLNSSTKSISYNSFNFSLKDCKNRYFTYPNFAKFQEVCL